MSKYDPLAAFLRNRPQEEERIALSLDEIERVLGAALPRTAKIDRPWWANTRSSLHALRWLDAGWKVDKVDFKAGRVTFIRTGAEAVESNIGRNRYENLQRFFKGIPPQQEQIALTFKELATVLGGKLPVTASHDRPWWANTKSSPQGSSWMAAGWKVERVYLKAQVVTFRRRGVSPLTSIPRYVEGLLNGSTHYGRPTPNTLASWLRFCKRVGWYFEATVLYERGGLNTDMLSESECAEVDEDYAVCKRELSRYKDDTNAMKKRNCHG